MHGDSRHQPIHATAVLLVPKCAPAGWREASDPFAHSRGTARVTRCNSPARVAVGLGPTCVLVGALAAAEGNSPTLLRQEELDQLK